MIRNVVVGVSDAASSHIAGRQAFELAEQYGATVHVVTAVDRADPVVIEIGSDRFVLDDVTHAKSAIDAFIHSIEPKVEWKTYAVDAKPARALLDVAAQVEADLIVVGNVRMQ